jgi:hypothetical protein
MRYQVAVRETVPRRLARRGLIVKFRQSTRNIGPLINRFDNE